MTLVYVLSITILTIVIIGIDSGVIRRLFGKQKTAVTTEDESFLSEDYIRIRSNVELKDMIECKQKNTGIHHNEEVYLNKAKKFSGEFINIQQQAFKLFK